MANDIITIDGTAYAVNITSLIQTSEFVDKYSNVTEDWSLRRELAGIFFNYEITLGDIQNETAMQELWTKLHEFTEFHSVTLPHDSGLMTFSAYITGASRSLLKRTDSANKWGGYVIKFIAKAPQISG